MAIRNFVSQANLQGISGAICGIRFVPGASTAAIVKQESWGIKSITRTSTGLYQIIPFGRPKGLIAVAVGQENDTTTYHFVRVEDQVDLTGVCNVSHKSVAYASVASGPAFSDTIDAITVLFYTRND